MTCPYSPMADPYNRERMLRDQYRQMRLVAAEMANALGEYAKLIEEGGGDAEDVIELLERFIDISGVES